MTVTTPPRPPRPDDPVRHGDFEALVEALIEEARQRARRRRRIYMAAATSAVLVAVGIVTLVERTAESQRSSTALAARSSVAAGAASSKIAFISEGPAGSGGYCGVVYVMNADGSDQRRLAKSGVPGCGQEVSPAWSPDGRRIAIVSNPIPVPLGPTIVSSSDIYVMNADGSGERRLTRTAGPERSPVWSPDGRKIAFNGRGGINVMNVDGSGRQNLAPGGFPAWSPDGRRIAFVSSDGIYVINADGSGERLLTRATVRYPASPVWSPDGRKIAFVSNWQVWVMNADGSGQRRLTRTSLARNVAPAWSPNGQRIAFERRVGRQKYRNTAREYGQCSRCDGRVRVQVYVVNADGSEARKLAQDSAHPVWSPDGRKIAFEYPRGPRGPGGLGKQTDIYVMNADGSGQRNLTRSPRQESQPVWSPAQK